MNDLLVAASIIGERNLTDLPACADLFVQMGRLVAGTPDAAADRGRGCTLTIPAQPTAPSRKRT